MVTGANSDAVTLAVAVLALIAAAGLFAAAQRNPVSADNINDDATVTAGPAGRRRQEALA